MAIPVRFASTAQNVDLCGHPAFRRQFPGSEASLRCAVGCDSDLLISSLFSHCLLTEFVRGLATFVAGSSASRVTVLLSCPVTTVAPNSLLETISALVMLIGFPSVCGLTVLT